MQTTNSAELGLDLQPAGRKPEHGPLPATIGFGDCCRC